jgi:pre-60S factor REI1
MPLLGATSETTTTTNMQSRLPEHIALPINFSLEDSSYNNSDDSSQQSQNMSANTTASSTPPLEQIPDFDPSTCLFCSQTHSSLAQSLAHMATSHSFYVQMTNLQVETTTLLARFHSIINEHNECLYCRKRFRSTSAARQHMLHKGHCMYDFAGDKDAEVKGFYDLGAAEADLEGVKAGLTARLEGLRVSQDHRKKPRFTAGAETWTPGSETRVSDGDGDDRDDDDDDHNYDDDARLGADTDASTPSLTSQDQQLIAPPVSRAQARAQHQPSTFDSQLSRLRESDRRSIQHLPTSQQRALLATQFKQMEMGGKAASARRGALESAGNSFGRLSSVRLVRIPPHSGRVQSLKH